MGRRISDKWVSQRGSPRQANNTFEPELRGIRSDTAAEMAAGQDDDGGAPTTRENSANALPVAELRNARLMSHSARSAELQQDVSTVAPNQVSWTENEHVQQVSNLIAASPSLSLQARGAGAARHAEL